MTTRRASHAGSWYAADASALTHALEGWLTDAASATAAHSTPPRALILPHAGLRYCGAIAAHAWRAISLPHTYTRVVLLGPSHHSSLGGGCGVSAATHLSTPLGALTCDALARDALLAATNAPSVLRRLSREEDEAEHSLELLLPFVVHVLGLTPRVLPILVGALVPGAEVRLGAALAPLLADAATLFLVSSDFCHYGQRFDFAPLPAACVACCAQTPPAYSPTSAVGAWLTRGALSSAGEEAAAADALVVEGQPLPPGPYLHVAVCLDQAAMSVLEGGGCVCSPSEWRTHLAATHNTVCGRNAIAVFLAAALGDAAGEAKLGLRFVRYGQSAPVMGGGGGGASSVSYAAAVASGV